MKTMSVVEAKASFSALLATVETGEEVCISRHGRVVARIVPERPRMAIDAFQVFWADDIDHSDWLEPSDLPPTPVQGWDKVGEDRVE
jgi:prevent-host-death family protein